MCKFDISSYKPANLKVLHVIHVKRITNNRILDTKVRGDNRLKKSKLVISQKKNKILQNYILKCNGSIVVIIRS